MLSICQFLSCHIVYFQTFSQDALPKKHHTNYLSFRLFKLNCNSLYISKYSCSFPNQSCVSEVPSKSYYSEGKHYFILVPRSCATGYKNYLTENMATLPQQSQSCTYDQHHVTDNLT